MRLPAVLQAEVLAGHDPSVGGLMALHVWQQGATPLFWYGQDFVGTWEVYWGAPFSWALGGHPSGWALSQAVAFAASLFPLYRLFHLVGGGRAGAVAAALVLAVGTPYAIEFTAGAVVSYLSTLYLGTLLLLVGPPAFLQPGAGRLFGLGLLVGLGWWNNPLIATFFAPVLLAAAARGPLLGARRAGWPPHVSPRARTLLLLLLAGALAFAFVCLLLLLHGPIHTRVLGVKVSLGRPVKYLVRSFACLAFVVTLLGGWLAADRRRWAALAVCLAAGAALGASPILLHRLLGRHTGRASVMLVGSPDVRENARQTLHSAREMLLGAGFRENDLPGLPGRLYAAWRVWAVAVAALALAGLLVAFRGEILALLSLRARGLSPPVVALLPALLIAGSSALRGGVDLRHFLPVWASLGALLAWLIGTLHRRHPALSVALAASLLAGQAIAAIQFATYDLPRMRHPEERRLIETLLAEGHTRGFGSAFTISKLIYLSRDGLQLGTVAGVDLLPRYTEAARQVPRPLLVLDTSDSTDRGLEAEHLERDADRTETRWRFGRYRVYRYRQVPAAPKRD